MSKRTMSESQHCASTSQSFVAQLRSLGTWSLWPYGPRSLYRDPRSVSRCLGWEPAQGKGHFVGTRNALSRCQKHLGIPRTSDLDSVPPQSLFDWIGIPKNLDCRCLTTKYEGGQMVDQQCLALPH